MEKKANRVWTQAEVAYLRQHYGIVPIDEICRELRMTRRQLYSKAQRLKIARWSVCKTCGRVGFFDNLRRRHYCSPRCRRIANTASHRSYVMQNRAHMKAYIRARRLQIWGSSTKEIATKAEILAIERILPRLGFSELFHASALKRYVPFDIVASLDGKRVLIDVTTGVSKSVVANAQQLFADALRMPMYVLFVKPDLSKYQLKLYEGSKTVQMHVADLIPVE